MPPSWLKLPTRTSYNLNAAADINALMDDLLVLAGNGDSAPGVTIQQIADLVINKPFKNLLAMTNTTNPTYQIDIAADYAKCG